MPRRRRGGRFLFAAVCTTAFVLAGLGLYLAYNSSSPEISEPKEPGQIFLFFDRPDVEARIEVRASADRGGASMSDVYDIDITVVSEATDPPRFFIVLSGTALPDQDLLGSSASGISNECGYAVLGMGDITCMATRGSPESAYASDESKEELIVVTGTIRPFAPATTGGSGWVSVSAHPRSVVESRDRRTFRLPTVGTVSLPQGLRAMPSEAIDNVVAFAPSLTTVVKYERLEATEVLEAASVEPVSRQPLTWVEQYGTELTASGSILDVVEQRRGERWVFLWGVLAGALGGFVAPIVLLWLRAWKGVP